MKGSFRQSMGWLHTWAGLWFGWVLLVVFMTGTLAVFAGPISYWMQPELMAHEREEARELAEPGASLPAERRVAVIQAHLAEARSEATQWQRIELGHTPNQDRYYWWQSDRGRELENGHRSGALGGLERIWQASGEIVADDEHEHPASRDSDGGSFFVTLHYSLSHDGEAWGMYVVFAASLVFLVALVSGIVVHKKIFADFFTFRRGKGQRSWLDAHNALAVLTLPFLLMIGWSGLDLLSRFDLPEPAHVASKYHRSAVPEASGKSKPPQPRADAPLLPVTDLAPLVRHIESEHGLLVTWLKANELDTQAPYLDIAAVPPANSFAARVFRFDASSGEPLGERFVVDSGTVKWTLRRLHMATLTDFGSQAELFYRWLLFISSALGTAMIAVGAVLFMVKRRNRALHEFGQATPLVYRAIEALNLAAIGGLALACIGYLWLNRLLPLELPAGWDERHHVEQSGFFCLWLASLGHALLRPPQRAWFEQMLALALLCLGLPLLNQLTTGEQFASYLAQGDLQAAGVELGAMVFGLLAAVAAGLLWRARHAQDTAPRARRKVEATA